MRKAETTNSFQKGMIMDLNPLTTPNDVLTNCLNGTIITFNGNEYVLQNDMGNGRVESAYLPEGYVPIGMKEHGGIVYVAAYNPLTNKGQIGSFPSPERNISSSEKNTSTGDNGDHVVQWDKRLSDDLIERYELFNNSTVIRSGDKFSVIFQTKDSRKKLSQLISNLDNVADDNGVTKIKSPKNKFMTISVCVLDSNNNLLDITDQLLRLNENSDIISPISDIPEIKFNTGYFAEFVTDLNGKDIDDYRKQKAVNVYNNKLFGELFIQAKINAIDNIDVTVDGIKNTSGSAQPISSYISINNDYKIINNTDGVLQNGQTLLMFEITYEYNCPDGYYTDSSTSDLYISDYGSKEDFNYDDTEDSSFTNAIKGCNLTITTINNGIELPFTPNNTTEKPKFDYTTKTYKYTTIYGVVVNSAKDIINYTVTPVLNYQINGVNITQNTIAVSDSINLDLIGSGDASLEAFKYYWNSTNIDLSYKFEIYPKYGQIIQGVGIHVYDLIACGQDTTTNPDIYTTIELASRNSYNGTLNENIPTSKFKERGIYLFKFYYTSVDKHNPTGDSTEIEIGSRVFINSGIFNQKYFTLTDFVPSTKKELDIMHDYKDVQIHSNINYTSNNSLLDSEVHGVLMSNNNIEGLNTYTQSYLYDTEFNITNNLHINNSQYYPFDFNPDAYTPSYTLSNFNANADITIYNSQGDTFEDNLLNFSSDTNISSSNQPKYKIDGTSVKVNAISRIVGSLEQATLNISSQLQPFINEQDGVYLFGQDGTLDYVSKFVGMEIHHNLFIGEDQTDAHFYLYSITRSSINTNGSPVQLKDIYHENQQAIIPVSIYTGENKSDAGYTDILLNAFGSSVFAFMCSTEMWDGNIQYIEGLGNGNWTHIKGCLDPNYRKLSNKNIADNMSAYLLKRWQLIWWRTASGQYTLIPYVYYFTVDPDLKSSTATTILGNDVIRLIKDSFKDIYLLQNVSNTITAYVFNSDNTQYNDTYDLKIDLTVNTSLTSNQEAFVVGTQSYNTIINNAANKFPSEKSLINSYKFNALTSDDVSQINTTIRINGTNSTYVSQKVMEAETLERVFINNDSKIIINDSTGMPFNYGKIYRLNNDNMEDCTHAIQFKALKAMKYNGKYTILAVPNRTINNNKFMLGWEYQSQSSPVYQVTLEDAPSIDVSSISGQTSGNLNMNRIQLDIPLT